MDRERGESGGISGGIGAGGQKEKGQNKVGICIKKIYDCFSNPWYFLS